MAKASPPNVFKAYLEQFQKDFSLFLRLRSEEIIQGGRVVLTFIGRSIDDPRSKDCCLYWELLAKSLLDLAAKGLVVEADIHTFNLPYYNPYEGEVREIIKMEGSFDIDKLETFSINWDANDDISNKDFVFEKDQCGRNVANIVRAVAEPMLVSHFGDDIIDELFKRYAEYVGNDFNTVFKSLPFFCEKFGKEKRDLCGQHYFITGVPGSFYHRLFPSKSLHFFHSSYSLHWLSKVPEGISNNKGNIYMAKASPPDVFKAYLEQFQKDFSLFLSLRSEEIIQGGSVVLTFIGRSIDDPRSKDCCLYWDLLAKSLLDLAAKVKTDIDTFNLPYYNPYEGEVREIIEMEGSFDIDKLETFAINWDANDDISNKDFVFEKDQCGRNVANIVRAVAEPMLVSHFGDDIMDELFKRYAEYVGEYLCVEKTKHINIVLTMTKKVKSE
ncbi:hypothetical protein D5086_033008 [Populus alba]|uniref:Uncharacterized protein n=1 Tax=Populus alba TaxID=43335 RepID=A0ACC4AFL6_POPAL